MTPGFMESLTTSLLVIVQELGLGRVPNLFTLSSQRLLSETRALMREVNFMLLNVKARILKIQQRFFFLVG